MKKPKKPAKRVKVVVVTCHRCQHQWPLRGAPGPRRCPKCYQIAVPT